MKILVKEPTRAELEELKVTQWDTWECEPATFDWNYDKQEVCYLIQGKVTVKYNKQEVTFEKGNLVTFPKGLSCIWVVHEKVEKYFKLG